MAVYCVVENGIAYEVAYTTYALAVAAVKEKHKEALSAPDAYADINGDSSTNITYLYIEKGIHIYINKLPIIGLNS
jgi:hypothetical protein